MDRSVEDEERREPKSSLSLFFMELSTDSAIVEASEKVESRFEERFDKWREERVPAKVLERRGAPAGAKRWSLF